jgi:hypothetical protein
MSDLAGYSGAQAEVHGSHRVIAFIELPIIRAPKRNSKLHKDMGTEATFFTEGRCRRSVCAPLHKALAPPPFVGVAGLTFYGAWINCSKNNSVWVGIG